MAEWFVAAAFRPQTPRVIHA